MQSPTPQADLILMPRVAFPFFVMYLTGLPEMSLSLYKAPSGLLTS